MSSYLPFWIALFLVVMPLLLYVRHHEQSRWRTFANAHELDYQPVFMEGSYSLEGRYLERMITVVFVGRREFSTSISISMNHDLVDFQCVVSPGVALFQRFTKDRILSGDVYLDENFECRGMPAEQVRRILHSKNFRTVIKRMDVKWLFSHFEIINRTFRIAGPFYARNPAELKELLALLYEIVDQLDTILNATLIPQNLDELQ